jgi:antitoxin VapB
MALQIKDKAILQQIDHLSRMRRVSKTEVIRTALRHEIEKEAERLGVRELLAPVLAKADAMGTRKPTTPEDDKRFFDELWGE